VVNVNPLYTPRELEHQLKDSGAKAIVILENFAHTLQQVISKTDVKHVCVATMGDLMGLKGHWSISSSARSRRWCRTGRCPAMSASRRPLPPAGKDASSRSKLGRMTSPSCNTPAARPAFRRARR
jgi:hypothetical protein